VDDVFFTGAAVILREHGFDVLADEITTMWTASRATVHGQATRIMELEEERAGLYRSLSESQEAPAEALISAGVRSPVEQPAITARQVATVAGLFTYHSRGVEATPADLDRMRTAFAAAGLSVEGGEQR
jgi:hypothetical protein